MVFVVGFGGEGSVAFVVAVVFGNADGLLGRFSRLIGAVEVGADCFVGYAGGFSCGINANASCQGRYVGDFRGDIFIRTHLDSQSDQLYGRYQRAGGVAGTVYVIGVAVVS